MQYTKPSKRSDLKLREHLLANLSDALDVSFAKKISEYTRKELKRAIKLAYRGESHKTRKQIREAITSSDVTKLYQLSKRSVSAVNEVLVHRHDVQTPVVIEIIRREQEYEILRKALRRAIISNDPLLVAEALRHPLGLATERYPYFLPVTREDAFFISSMMIKNPVELDLTIALYSQALQERELLLRGPKANRSGNSPE